MDAAGGATVDVRTAAVGGSGYADRPPGFLALPGILGFPEGIKDNVASVG